jgi:hypothetical protein
MRHHSVSMPDVAQAERETRLPFWQCALFIVATSALLYWLFFESIATFLRISRIW